MKTIALFAAFTLAILSASPDGQTPPRPPDRQPPTFRVEVNYVEIDATVTDAQGKFVNNLTKEDFEVVEEGELQTISAFTVVDLPVEKVDPPLFRGAPVEPDVRTNIGEFNGRVLLIILDDLQTDSRRSLLVRAAAKQFIRRFVGVNDLVAVVHTGGRATAGQEFTSSQALILAAVDRFAGMKARTNDGAPPVEVMSKARSSLRALGAAAEFLAGMRGRRKAVVWFGEGVDYDIENPMNTYALEIRDEMNAAIGAATRAGVSFYAVDARGVGAGLDEAIDIGALDLEAPNESGLPSILNATRRAQNFLRTVSTETGGFAVVNQNNLNGAFEKIIQENSSYYLLGYYPTNDTRDGKYRKLLVRVKRPGLQVKYRNGYVAPKGKPAVRERTAAAAAAPPDLRAALESPMPVPGLGMRVFAAPFSGPSRNGSVVIIVEFDPARLKFEATREGFAEDLELIISPVNAAGKPFDGARDRAPLRLSQRSYDLARSNGLRMVRRLDLPPGRYQLHVAAKASNGNAVGGLSYDLDVPDFSKPALAMSGITLMAASAARILTPPPDKEFTAVLPVAATALRDFPAGDTISVYVEVYDNRAGTPHRVEIKTSVTSDDGKAVFSAADQRRTEEIQAKSGGFGHTTKIPLAGYRPGRYVLRVEARTSVSGGAAVSRDVEFRVR